MTIAKGPSEESPLGPRTTGRCVLDLKTRLASFVPAPFSVAVFLLALVAGGLVTLPSHPELLMLGAVGGLLAIPYAARPLELARRGLGGRAALLTCGLGAVLGFTGLILCRVPASAIFPSFSVGHLVAASSIAFVLPVLAVAGGARPRVPASLAGVPFAVASSRSLRTESDGPIPVRARATAFLATVTGGLGLAVAFLERGRRPSS